MTIQLLKNRVIGDVQQDFNELYPFLRIDFYRQVAGRLGSSVRQKLNKSVRLSAAGRLQEGDLEVEDSTTVGQLEKNFRERFGLNVQVSRKSGPIWLETTITDKWTLKQQNEHGRELSTPVKKTIPDEDAADYDN